MVTIKTRTIHLDSKRQTHTLLLTNISGKPLGQIPHGAIQSIDRNMNDPDNITITIPRYYMDMVDINRKDYILFNEFKNERLLWLDDTDVFVIRTIDNKNDQLIEVKGISREIRLQDIDALYEDCGFYFYSWDNKKQLKERLEQYQRDKLQEESQDKILLINEEIKKIEKELYDREAGGIADYYSLDSELKRYTGWGVGNVSDKVRYSNKRIEKDWTKNTKPSWYTEIEGRIKFKEDEINRIKKQIEEYNLQLARVLHEHKIVGSERPELTDPIKMNISKAKVNLIERELQRDDMRKELDKTKKAHWEEITDLKPFESDKWIESVDKTWYDFIIDDFKQRFDCEVIFDSVNKKVHFLKEDEIPDHIGLYLSKDNYIKSMERTYESDNIVTQLKVEGNAEMDITNAVCTGSPYIENYKYFLENDEMSTELINALNTYYKMVEKREPQWREKADEINYLENKKTKLAGEFTLATAKYNACMAVIQAEDISKTDPMSYGRLMAKATEMKNQASLLELQIQKLEEELKNLSKSLDNIVKLCQKKTATDDNGRMIFNDKLIDELKNFSYTETYKNDSFLTENIGQLIELAKRILRDKALPTRTWDLDVVNFISRVTPSPSYDWNGDLSLGDIIIIYDKDMGTEEFVYLNSFSINYHDNSIKLHLSNKKTNKANGLTIADYITKARDSMRIVDSKKYLLIQQKYNRLNLPKEYIPKYREKDKKYPYGTSID